MNLEIKNKLEKLAISRTNPFCYGCYISAPKGVCPKCHSDDLMRELKGVGVEWGTEWVIKHIIESELTSIDTDEIFEESIREIYPETVQVGWMNLDTVTVMKDQDSTSWQITLDEYISNLEEDGEIISFDHGSTFYRTIDLEELIE